ncbi:MAG: M1 family metallopeptidase [Chitinophagaceae bacterium]|nr:M1 family metallopeptidase [Chitinophagaceae bacterium]
MKHGLLLIFGIILSAGLFSQSGYWQQRVKYNMDIDVDATANTFTGKQKLEYTNNSPDTLDRLFYHLYWNAFQPNSMMDARSIHMGKVRVGSRPEWDPRVKDRIANLKPNEIGYQKISSLTMNGVAQKFSIQETILEVDLTKPILPGQKVTLQMDFNAQIPVQIRRSGRDAANGVRYSMSQWYPKLCEYDKDGWHPTPYVGREFYGVWGDFDVKISIDKTYILGGTGYLQNPQQIGFGYEAEGTKAVKPAGNKLTWHFVAPNVHDFVWAADPGYKHLTRKINNGPVINVLYKSGTDEEWKQVADAAVAVFPFITKNFGAYPYKQYSFIQGGDGGMEYPMATLLAGPGLGTVFHEWMHTWYQMMLGTNESLYAWMDEGFTEWATNKVQDYYANNVVKKRPGITAAEIASIDSTSNILPKYHSDNYAGYYYLVKTGLEEPLTTHADHFETNTAYSIAAYNKGCVFLSQLGYIVGDSMLNKIMLAYYDKWKFKHPDANDFVRLAEKESGIELDWYQEYFVNTTKTIDYSIDSLWEEGGKTNIRLKRIGKMPMPIDVQVDYKDGSKEIAYVPLYDMFGSKPVEDRTIPRTDFEPWKWTHAYYTVSVNRKIGDIKVIEIDASERMADTERKNNRLEIPW